MPDLGAQAPGTFGIEFEFRPFEDTERFDVQTDLRAELDPGIDPRTDVAKVRVEARGAKQ